MGEVKGEGREKTGEGFKGNAQEKMGHLSKENPIETGKRTGTQQ